MHRESAPARRTARPHLRRGSVLVIALLAGLGVAGLLGVAVAHSFTLEVVKDAKVTSQGGSVKHENIVATAKGAAVYELTGDSKAHPECTNANGCFRFWPPVKVASAHDLSKAPGIGGKLGTWRHDGFLQVTLGGHPLYTFSGDAHKRQAVGEGIVSFGGTWHVVKASGGGSGGGGQMSPSNTTTTTTTTTSPGGCLYPPCPY
jgi:predicted lipoprotein with Yx(FWY)xxD motif